MLKNPELQVRKQVSLNSNGEIMRLLRNIYAEFESLYFEMTNGSEIFVFTLSRIEFSLAFRYFDPTKSVLQSALEINTTAECSTGLVGIQKQL